MLGFGHSISSSLQEKKNQTNKNKTITTTTKTGQKLKAIWWKEKNAFHDRMCCSKKKDLKNSINFNTKQAKNDTRETENKIEMEMILWLNIFQNIGTKENFLWSSRRKSKQLQMWKIRSKRYSWMHCWV